MVKLAAASAAWVETAKSLACAATVVSDSKAAIANSDTIPIFVLLCTGNLPNWIDPDELHKPHFPSLLRLNRLSFIITNWQ